LLDDVDAPISILLAVAVIPGARSGAQKNEKELEGTGV
jgi:hypothetical protein